ncbi:hypothetical protein HMPREF1556_01255 [Porphyromonas sp. oral taxon 278 str. W7784]|nr:hypothetical protein HMPREF1556_01255 [Porphyromonas sp. oral taxon 278 str. W7784]
MLVRRWLYFALFSASSSEGIGGEGGAGERPCWCFYIKGIRSAGLLPIYRTSSEQVSLDTLLGAYSLEVLWST